MGSTYHAGQGSEGTGWGVWGHEDGKTITEWVYGPSW
jgi:hypothetical protein